MFRITYKVTLKRPLYYYPLLMSPTGEIRIAGSSMRGAARSILHKPIQYKDMDIEEKNIFGNRNKPARVHFSDLVATVKNIELIEIVTSQNEIMNLPSSKLTYKKYIPSGTEFIGHLNIHEDLTGIDRSLALSLILDISNRGLGTSKGYGLCDIEIIDRDRTTVSISYAWGDDNYMKWVYNLALELSSSNIDVILDQMSTSFDVDAPQERINHWMNQAIRNSDKIIAILTPSYCDKAYSGLGGVGYEYQRLIMESNKISSKVQRYIGVFHSGDIDCRPPQPENMLDMPIIDLSLNMDKESIDKLVQSIVSSI